MMSKAIDSALLVLPRFAERYSGVSSIQTGMLSRNRGSLASQPPGPVFWKKIRPGAAPVLIIACCDTVLSKTGQLNAFGPYDTGAASVSMCLQAAALGLMMHQMAGFVAGEARELFQIAERFDPLAMMAVWATSCRKPNSLRHSRPVSWRHARAIRWSRISLPGPGVKA